MRALDDGLAVPVESSGNVTEVGDPVKLRAQLQAAMTSGAGVLRSRQSLEETLDQINAIGAWHDQSLRNLTEVARALVTAALARQESRGNHTRTDFPQTDVAFRRRIVIR
jgi:L-aspartate oxidase